MSHYSWPHGLQHDRPRCPSPSPRVSPSSRSLNWWCYPTISSCVALFFCFQSFPASRSFPMSWQFTSGGQTTGASASVPPVNIQYWFLLMLTGLISLLSKGLSRIFSSTIWSISSFVLSHLYGPTVISINVYWKNNSFGFMELCRQVMCLLFNILSGFVILNIMKTNTPWINRFSWKHHNWEKTATTAS